jgi:hypothetical protein
MDLGGLVVRWAGLGYAVAHPDHPLSTPLEKGAENEELSPYSIFLFIIFRFYFLPF